MATAQKVSLALVMLGMVVILVARVDAAPKRTLRTRLTITELHEMARGALALEGPCGLTTDELVAMCLVESGGDAGAIGDGGQAVGLFQFHGPTWTDHADSTWSRRDAVPSFRTAIRYAKRAQRLLRASHQGTHRDLIWSHHNQGNIRAYASGYVGRCRRMLVKVQQASAQ